MQFNKINKELFILLLSNQFLIPHATLLNSYNPWIFHLRTTTKIKQKTEKINFTNKTTAYSIPLHVFIIILLYIVYM